MQHLLDYLNITKYSNQPLTPQIITKKSILEAPTITAKTKRYIKDEIESIILEVTINSNNTNIPSYTDESYNYQEIAIISIIYKDSKKTIHEYAIFEALSQLILNPTIFLIQHQQNYMVRANIKRKNKIIAGQSVLEYTTRTQWLTPSISRHHQYLSGLNMGIFSFRDLYTFHTQFASYIQQSILLDIIPGIIWTQNISYYEFKEMIQKYNDISAKINSHYDELRQTTEIGDRISIKQSILDQEKLLSQEKEKIKTILEKG